MTELKSSQSLDQLCIDAIRVLSMDAVQKADSGHPGTPMALAPLAYVLWTRHLRYNPKNPDWANRDRFVLSAGHASMLLYSLLYLSGYDLSLDDIKHFRQWESRTPGHPEYGYTPGVETTTGPLGQGVGNSVGMAIAEAQLAAIFNRPNHEIIDHHTYFIASDGDMMEGISHEASSYAGHLKLGKLIGFYDDNHITIEGDTDLTFSDDTAKRFEAYHWHVQRVEDANDLEEIDRAIIAAKEVEDRPSMIIVRSHIGFGSPNKHDTAEAHGSPLGAEEIKLTKEALGYPSDEAFYVPPDALEHWRTMSDRGLQMEREWQQKYESYKTAHPDDSRELERRLRGELLDGWEQLIPDFTADNGNIASRAASGIVLNAIAAKLPELVGGSADLASSTNTIVKGAPSIGAEDYSGRNFHFGIREHGMGAVMNGMAVHGGFIPYGATFLIFSDYMRPAVRLAALMHQHVIYVYTHDSIGLGEDGPTHQPIEQLSTLRAIPDFTLIRPADASETAEAWRAALKQKGPVGLVLTRQKLGFIDRTKYASAAGVSKGAYVLADSPGGPPQVVLMSSGSEVALIVEAQQRLEAEGVRCRTVSMPSHEIFAAQSAEYRESVLPKDIKRVSIEASHPMSWDRWVCPGGGVAMGIERFGASAPYKELYEHLGITVAKLVDVAKGLAT